MPENSDNKENPQSKKPGLYLRLFHGFPQDNYPDEIDDWGEQGPSIGPLNCVHTTYMSCIKYQFSDIGDARKFGLDSDGVLDVDGDTILHEGIRYGDWTVYYESGDSQKVNDDQ